MKFFGLEMTPPLPPFWTFFPKFTTKIYRFETKKICNVIFWIGNDPPPFGSFPKKHPNWGIRSPLMGKVHCTGSTKGRSGSPKWMFFWKISEGGVVISNPKNYIADFFDFKTVYFGRKFWKRYPKSGEGSSPIQKNSLQIYAS